MQEQDFQQIATAQQIEIRKLSADDLQHELSGQETGRLKRHLPRQQNATQQEQEKEKEQRAQSLLTLAMLLANDPEYAKLHRETMDMITRAENATEIAITKCEERLRLAQEQLSLTLQNATRIPDGQGGSVAVFKDAQGQVWTEHDEEVTDQSIIDGIAWKDGSPSRETLRQDRHTITHEQDTLAELQHYQVDVLGDAREQLMDNENPSTSDIIQKISDNVEAVTPQAVKQELSEVELVTHTPSPAVENKFVPSL